MTLPNPDAPLAASPGPVEESSRITSLDLTRGVAVLGILLMNSVAFKYGWVPYWNISAGGSHTWLDWAVAIFGEIFIDQKFMGLFSLLFGAGVMLFIDRASSRQRHPVRLNLWRNILLLGMGVAHYLLWDGDVLILYAIASVFLISLRRVPARVLVGLGVVVFLLPVAGDWWAQSIADGTGAPLDDYWTESGASMYQPFEMVVLSGYLLRAMGMILLGAGLYRLGFIQGLYSAAAYRRTAIVGLSLGLTLAALGVALVVANDFSGEVAFVGNIPNNLGTIPASLGYLSLIVLWDKRAGGWLKERLVCVGRMALTNYLTQTVLGVLILTVALAGLDPGRSGVLLFVVAVWVAQLWWSQAWLARFRFGPAEWLWRVATYRRGQPLRRA